jgi:hypothetical protein
VGKVDLLLPAFAKELLDHIAARGERDREGPFFLSRRTTVRGLVVRERRMIFLLQKRALVSNRLHNQSIPLVVDPLEIRETEDRSYPLDLLKTLC